ncbi:MAG: RDD family protein [Kangiellaceae bacterium]|jgi:uncharacterized RDD family membrane protein YckC|nr:RDD family protein [Kangiellaceae bacterium]
MEPTPNYSSYSLNELYDALSHVDKETYPERIDMIRVEIEKRNRQSIQNTVLHGPWIASFWARLFALIIDLVVLAIVGFLIGMVFEDKLVKIGGWGLIIGFAIAVGYFGLMNSRLCNGQTIGKMMLGIKVVDGFNNTISIELSLLRYIILGVPFFLNGAPLNIELAQSFVMYLVSLIVFGGTFAIIYLYIFNRITRQSLHDLIVGSYVVNVNANRQGNREVWKPHLGIAALLLLLSALAPAVIDEIVSDETFNDLLNVQTKLLSEPDVSYAGVAAGVHYSSLNDMESNKSTYLNAEIFLLTNNIENNGLARKMAAIVVNNYPEAANKDTLNITLIYGYDLGIWSFTQQYTHVFKPTDVTI